MTKKPLVHRIWISFEVYTLNAYALVTKLASLQGLGLAFETQEVREKI